ncbi:30S ribosomal protein S9 [Candidatus Daviesbacteria bacterium]|nr:30S ribosomal protein S9 [Candidatus Daviesbacteria bacterium]
MEDKAKQTSKTKDLTVRTVGRRKEAVARVFLLPGKGQITVNGQQVSEYFKGIALEKIYKTPFELTDSVGKFDISIKVIGGGTSSQLGAVIHGISRALSKVDPSKRAPLKKAGLLTRDPRVKERRKYGLAQKARAKKQSPKR